MDSLWDQPGMTPEQARSDAIERVDSNADEEWKDVAYDAIVTVARHNFMLTADEVWDILNAQELTTHEPAALGPVFLRASKKGVITKTSITRLSRQTQRHRDLTVWKSNIVEDPFA